MESPSSYVEYARFIPWLPAAAAALCGVCCMHKSLRVLAAPLTVLGTLGAFVMSVMMYLNLGTEPVQTLFTWMKVGSFQSDMGYYLDPLTAIMLMVITGIGTLVAWYAAWYMKGDKGYARFFAAVSLFIFAMTTLVMADNLVLLYLGWEGVGLCSYLLIGYYYDKPSAVAAAKKAFIVNRIGDLGFALGLMFTYVVFGSIQYDVILPAATAMFQGTQDAAGHGAQVVAAMTSAGESPQWMILLIPFLLMLGAFGKSAQLPLYMWLPDAMEGPTPVSALIHAATMVTAGVYMIARMLPVFQLSPYALTTVAVIGGATALFAATIALCQYDIKRIYAYSTISQLGYMFLAVGVLSSTGAVFHLFTHAFFKALLFLTAGSVMHALAGQLDLRQMSGLRHKLPVTCWLMFIGCLALAGVPLTAGFFSKDMILAEVFARGLDHHQPLIVVLGVVGLITAFMTAYYTFRLWFRVFMGPERFEMGDEHHGDEAHGEVEHAPHAHEPHEMPAMMNAPLVILALGTVLISLGCVFGFSEWFGQNISGSTAQPLTPISEQAVGEAHGGDHHTLHLVMMIVSGVLSIGGIALAAWLHWFRRDMADNFARKNPGLVKLIADKFYVDEICDALIVSPLRFIAKVLHVVDQLVIHGLAMAVAQTPRVIGLRFQTLQTGSLQHYGLYMLTGVVCLVAVVYYMAN